MSLHPEYDDDYPTCEETHAAFRLYRHNLEPDKITKLLGLAPTSTQRRGERLKPERGRPVPALIGGWFLSSEGEVDSKDLRRHLDWVIQHLEPRAKVLHELRDKGYHMDVHCFWSSAANHGGPTLSPPQTRALAELDLDIWFDVFFVEHPPDDEVG